jgi:hypothetical protein
MRYKTALILAAAIGAASLYTPAAEARVWVRPALRVHAPSIAVPVPAVGAYFGPAPYWGWGSGYFGGYRRFGRGFYGFGHSGFGYRSWGYHRR